VDFSRYDIQPDMADFIQKIRADIRAILPAGHIERDAVERDEHDPGFFRAAGQRGWIVPRWPTSKGGAGFTERQASILETELLRVDAPSANIVTSQMVLPTVDKHGSDALRAEVLDQVAGGETGISLGYTEPDGGSDIAQVQTRAVRSNGEWIINGSKLYTTGAHHCGYCFLLAKTNSSGPKHRSLTMFLVPMDRNGIHVSPIHTLGERTNGVSFDDTRLDDAYRVGEVDDGWNVLMEPLSIEHGLSSQHGPGLGDIGYRHARRLAQSLDAATNWAIDTGATDLETLRRLARALVEVEAATSVWGTRGRVASAEALVRGTAELLDVLGSDVFSDVADSPAGFLSRWVGQAQISTIYGGTVEVFKNVIAQELGLPRQSYTGDKR
jgi:alkylation response protein AidB-like acyl-CoA dehydrogenase